MSSNSYTQQASNAASKGVENVAYGAERTGQVANDASTNASATTGGYVDQAKNVAATAYNTAQDYAAAAGTTLTNAAGQTTNAVNNLTNNAAATTDRAVAEGHQDVKNATGGTNTTGYVEQAKSVVGTTLSTAQDYVAAAGQKIAPADPSAPGVINTLQGTAATALNTGAQYIGSANAAITGTSTQQVAHDINNAASQTADAAKANLNASKDSAQPYVDQAKDTANQASANVQNTAQSNYGAAKDTTQTYTDKAKDTGYQASANTQNTYNSSAKPYADDTAARANELKKDASEGVNAYLKLGQEKTDQAKNDFNNSY